MNCLATSQFADLQTDSITSGKNQKPSVAFCCQAEKSLAPIAAGLYQFAVATRGLREARRRRL